MSLETVPVYGLRRTAELGEQQSLANSRAWRTAEHGEAEHGTDAKEFVLRNFNVDNGITSVASEEIAIDLLKRTQRMLSTANLKLHKMVSNSTAVMEAVPPEDRANELKDLDLSSDPLPLQRSLGISWDLKSDCFTFRVSRSTRPFTRRGMLSTVNSLYDPLGLNPPITTQGKALIRGFTSRQ